MQCLNFCHTIEENKVTHIFEELSYTIINNLE